MTPKYKLRLGQFRKWKRLTSLNQMSVINDKKWTVKYAQDKLSKKMEVHDSQALKQQDLKDSGLATCDIITICSSPRYYKIYRSVKLSL